MGIKTDPANPLLHHIDCRPDGYRGKRFRAVFEGSRAEAENYYRNLMRQPSEQAAALPKAPTIKAIWPEYERHCRLVMQPSMINDLHSCWRKHLSPFFGGLQPKMLNRKLFEQYQEQRLAMKRFGRDDLATVKPRTVTKELHYLSGMLNWAAEIDL